MRKTFLIGLLVLLTTSTAYAGQRSLKAIKQNAVEVLSRQAHRRALAADEQQMTVIQQNEQLTVIGGKAGFAVIANDDRFPPVLGYSDKEYIDGEVAPGYLWWLEAITEQLEYNREHNLPMASVAPATDKYKANVGALLVTEWGQNAPYYNMTPTYLNGKNEVHYVTGCVATAMAQIMYYHKWPEKGKGTISYYFTPEGTTASQKLSVNLAKEAYDWNNMLPIYKGVKYTEAQGNAVAALMMHCGYSVNMQYTKTGSGAYTSDAADAMRKRFYYNENMHFYWRSYFPEEEWMENIFRELNDGNPILYGAQRSDGGHEFVLDGYNEEGQVHVNWGWDGNQNGFFDIASLNGYTTGQEMVIIRKNDIILPYQSYWGMENLQVTLTGSNIRASYVAYNLDYNAFSGKISLLAMNTADGNISELTAQDVSNVEYMSGFNFTLNANISTLADGTYRIYSGSFSEKDLNWQPIRCHEGNNNSYLLTISGSKVSVQKENNANWTPVHDIRYDSGFDVAAPLYDLLGRRVPATGKKGIYIRNGRKIVH